MHYLVIVAVLFSIALQSTEALADSISQRVGLTGKLGATVQFHDDFVTGTSRTQAGFSGGGGLIYGINSNLAAEVEATHMPDLDVEVNGTKTFEAAVTDISLGLQYRFFPDNSLVPFVGAGADFIHGNLKYVKGSSYEMDWAYGGHVNIGLDWFLNPGIAFSVDLRGVFAANADVLNGSVKVSRYSPQFFQGTLGVRLMLPKEF